MRSVPVLAFLTCLTACGSGSGTSTDGGTGSSSGSSSGGLGSASVIGTIEGSAFTAGDTSAWIQGDNTVIEIVTSPGLCSLASAHAVKANSSVISMAFGYQVIYDAGFYQDGTGLDVSYYRYDGTCTQTNYADSTGSVTLTQISPVSIGGTFDVTFAGSDRVTGSFSAPVCTSGSLAYADAGQAAPACD